MKRCSQYSEVNQQGYETVDITTLLYICTEKNREIDIELLTVIFFGVEIMVGFCFLPVF